MKKVLVLVGVRGAGKSTLLDKLRQLEDVVVLQPSTTRKPRTEESSQYHFVDCKSWMAQSLAWNITVGDQSYGMRSDQLASIPLDKIAITVFHPGNIGVLEQVRRERSNIEFVTIGLDTIDNSQGQAARIGSDKQRDEGADAFLRQREIVRNCDIILMGDENVVFDGAKTIVSLLQRGGVLDGKSIQSLIHAGALLDDADSKCIQPASYDLRLGDTYWCKGQIRKLTDENPIATIPPYSYVIAQAMEVCRLSNFIIGRYDIKVSLFFKGVTLSNGPQVDPGYSGPLFCLLFNASDSNVGIRRGEHFATIEFHTTTSVTDGYKEHHGAEKSLAEFMESSSVVSSGGTLADQFKAIESSWTSTRNAIIGVGLAILIPLIPLIINLVNKMGDAKEVIREAQRQQAELKVLIESANKRMVPELEKRVDILERKLDSLSVKEQPIRLPTVQ